MNHRSLTARLAAIGLPMGLLLLTGLAWWQFTNRESQPVPEILAPPVPPLTVDRQSMFDHHVQPLLDRCGAGNRQSAERCSQRVHEQFAAYRKNVGVFVDDITSTWTRLGILRRMPADWWREDGRVEKYVQAKFEKHIFSEGN